MTAITLNGTRQAVSDDLTIFDLVVQAAGRPLGSNGHPLNGSRLGMAVAVDARVIPRSSWNRTPVVEGQHIEIITAVQGG